MADTPDDRKPPYATWSTLTNFVQRIGENGVPPVIDRSTMQHLSGSVQSVLSASLRSTALIDDAGVPTQLFHSLVAASDQERPQLLRKVLQNGFPFFFENDFNLSACTAQQFDQRLRDRGGLSGSTLDKAASFFLQGADETGVQIGAYLKARKPSVKKKTTKGTDTRNHKRKADDTSDQSPVPPPSPPPPSNPLSQFHPFVQGLLQTLPDSEQSEWSHKDRVKWLTAAANVFDLIYAGEGKIIIELKE